LRNRRRRQFRGEAEPAIDDSQPDTRLSRRAAPSPARSQASAPQFANTVSQNMNWNSALLDLWRNICCASIAPGQPPSSPIRCRVLSGVRQWPFLAADLSLPSARIASRVNPPSASGTIAGIAPTTHASASVARLATPATLLAWPARGDRALRDSAVFLASRSAANSIRDALSRPFASLDASYTIASPATGRRLALTKALT